LKSLDENYPDEWALDIIKHLVYSSSNKVRYEILKLLIKENDDVLTTNNIAEMMKIGYKASFRELNTLWNLGLVIRFTVEEVRGNKLVELCKWKTNKENDIVQKLYRLFASYKIVEEEDIK
jgi:predicted transcriptional regulator